MSNACSLRFQNCWCTEHLRTYNVAHYPSINTFNLLYKRKPPNNFYKACEKALAAPPEIDGTMETQLEKIIIHTQTWHARTQKHTSIKFNTSLLSQVIVLLARYSHALAEFAKKEVQIMFGAGISGIQIIPAAGIVLFRARALLLSAWLAASQSRINPTTSYI